MTDDLKPPVRSRTDTAYAAAKAAISAVPFAGGPGAEFFAYLVAAPLENRRQEWMERVGLALRELTERVEGLDESLRHSPDFADLALKATQVAMRTSASEKREALFNAVVNGATGAEPDAEVQHLFLVLVDELTVQQLQLLDLFENPRAWSDQSGRRLSVPSMGALAHIVEAAFPRLTGHRSLYDQLWRNLYARGLLSTESLHVTMSGDGLMAGRVTELGARFLRFIRRQPS